MNGYRLVHSTATKCTRDPQWQGPSPFFPISDSATLYMRLSAIDWLTFSGKPLAFPFVCPKEWLADVSSYVVH
jgi:hypothetical protein